MAEDKKKCNNSEVDEDGNPINPIEPTDENEVYLMAPIYDDTAMAFCRTLDMIPKDEDVNVLMNSPGGSVFAGWSIIGRAKERKGKLNCKVYGHAASMSMFFLLYCDYAEAIEPAKFMIHRADMWVENEDDQKLLDSVNKDLRAVMESKLDTAKLKEITGLSMKDIFEGEVRRDVWLTAKEAKKVKLINEVIRMNKEQVKAFNNKFVGFVNPERGSEGKSRGSEAKQMTSEKENKSVISNNQKPKTMTREELKLQNPDLFAAIFAEGKAEGVKAGTEAERIRVKAWMSYLEYDQEGVVKAIKEGSEMTMDVQSELQIKVISKTKLKAVEKDGKDLEAGKTETEEQKNKTEHEKQVNAVALEVRANLKKTYNIK